MVRKKLASDLKMKIYNESLSRGKIYIGKRIYIYWKKRKGQPCHTNWKKKKKSKDTQLVSQKKKSTVRGAKLQLQKSAQYQVEQNSNDNYLVSQELTYYSFT